MVVTLVAVQGDMKLAAPTARAWSAFVESIRAKHGVTLTITSPGGAHRSDALVRDMYLNKWKYGIPASQPVAKPRSLGGGGSVHENGRCVDIWNHGDVPRASLVATAKAHGFTFTIPTEPWHIQHDGTTTAGGGGSGVTPIQKKRTLPMYVLLNVIDTKLVQVQGIDGRREGVQGPAHLDALIRHRDAMVAGVTMDVYLGDLIGNLGAIDWYLGRVNGPRANPDFDAQLKALADNIDDLNPDGADFEFSDEDLAKIAANVDLGPVIEAVQAGDTRVLAAISQVDENTLATFGLKRA